MDRIKPDREFPDYLIKVAVWQTQENGQRRKARSNFETK
jgi:hypothetical protein